MRRSGFTLVEMLVVLVIVITLTAIVVGALRQDDSDRLNSAARLVQQKIMRAKSSATSDRAVRGVRLERGVNDPRIVTGLSMIGSAGYVTGTLSDMRVVTGNPSTTGDDFWVITGATAGHFNRLAQRGLLTVGSHIEIPNGSGAWYTLSPNDFSPASNRVSISGHYDPSQWHNDTNDPQNGRYIVSHKWDYFAGLQETIEFRLELQPSVMSGEATIAMPPGTCIEIDASQVPDTWRAPGANFDLLFNANGGTEAGTGLIHLYVTRLADVELTRGMFPDHPANGGTRPFPIVPANAPHVPDETPYVITVLKNTGMCFMSDVDLSDADSDQQADAPYANAKKGQQLE